MNKKVELPIIEPMYSTYHHQCAATAIISSNPSIKNWGLNESVSLYCERKFLNGFTTPLISVLSSQYERNPHLNNVYINLIEDNRRFNTIVRQFIDTGYYIYFNNIDDYYLNEKTWFKERHFYHDGIICGYDSEAKLYCVYAYDKSWALRKIWIPYRAFNRALHSTKEAGRKGYLIGLKPTDKFIKFEPRTAIKNICKYLDSSFEKYPKNKEGFVFGTIVHDYISIYLDKLSTGSIPYERMDKRVFRVIWEQKKVMYERIKKLEESLSLCTKWSIAYEKIVQEANSIRLLYASYSIRRRDNALTIIKEKLMWIKKQEIKILSSLIKTTEGVILK